MMKGFKFGFCVAMFAIHIGMADCVADVYGGTKFADGDFIVDSGRVFNPDNLYVNTSLKITNNGVFDTELHLCDGCDLYVVNKGSFAANIYYGVDANAYQLITSAEELNPLDVNSGYVVFVRDANRLGVNDVLNVAGGADKIIVADSNMDLNKVVTSKNIPIEFQGRVVFYVDDLGNVYGVPLLNNVSGDADITFVMNDKNPLYADVGYIANDALYVKRLRETDYVKVLGNDVGVYLNNIRVSNPNDGLLRALDSVTDMDSLYGVMNDSVRLNPNRLLESVRIIGAFDRFDFGINTGVGVQSGIVGADNFYAYDTGVNFNAVLGGVQIGAGLRFGEINYRSSLDEFDGVYYGVNLYVNYLDDSNYFVRGGMDVRHFGFYIDNVFYDGAYVSNPNVIAGNAVVDFGRKYIFGDAIYLSPFIGLDVAVYSLEDIVETDLGVRAGVGAGYVYQLHGIRYDYGTDVIANSNDEIGVRMRAGFWSNYDEAGGDIAVSVARIFDMLSYKVAVGARIWF